MNIKNITPEKVEKIGKAEKDSKKILEKEGFEPIIDLNYLSEVSQKPSFDLLAKYDGKWWLIDVSINCADESLSEIPLIDFEKYQVAILQLFDDKYRFIKLVPSKLKGINS